MKSVLHVWLIAGVAAIGSAVAGCAPEPSDSTPTPTSTPTSGGSPTASPTATPGPSSSIPRFQQHHIDAAYNGNQRPGFVAPPFVDLDGDGRREVVAAGGTAMNVYSPTSAARTDWTRHVKFDGDGPGANGGAMVDVNRDGRPDLITAIEFGGNQSKMYWFESPTDPIEGDWAAHMFDPLDLSFVHDVVVADLDNDGVADEIVITTENRAIFDGVKWYDVPTGDFELTWSATIVFDEGGDNDAGLAVADIDRDGRNDIIYNRFWFRAPVDPSTPNWELFVYDPDESNTSNLQVVDLDGDGRLDIVVAEGHSFSVPFVPSHIEWWEAPPDPTAGGWVRHQISNRPLDHPENLALVDVDGDGDLDVITGELMIDDGWNDSNSNLIIYENVDIAANQWQEHVVVAGINACHLLAAFDLDDDGDVDLVCEGAGEPFVDWLENIGP